MKPCVECGRSAELGDNWPSLGGPVCVFCEAQLYAAQLEPEPECLRSYGGDGNCRGGVTYRASYAGTGTRIAECSKHQQEAAERDQRLRQVYPDTPTPPSWFDPTYAGESWNDDY
ncbi:hypothetical protein [Nonomuraea sp. NPDC023979]|uniref:hypothetical protein n=1 Tax=Nonomuraea sp. NPDC023979 TaxID=3154796 RepID=UPI0033F9990A